MSEYMQDSGHFWLHTCDDCGGAFPCAPPKSERAAERGEAVHDWVCKSCATKDATIRALANALLEQGEHLSHGWHILSGDLACNDKCTRAADALRLAGRLP